MVSLTDIVGVAAQIMVVFLMLGMGAAVQFSKLKMHMRRPWPVLCGIASQFFAMPLIAFTLANLASSTFPEDRRNIFSLSILVIGCMPGGTTSNLFCYWAGGDIGLSIMMTCFSSFVGLGMVPAMLALYAQEWTDDGVSIDNLAVIQGIGLALVPAAVGIVTRNWDIIRGNKSAAEVEVELTDSNRTPADLSPSERLADRFENVASKVGAFFILFITITGFINDPSLFTKNGVLWIVLIFLSPCGFVCGFLFGNLGAWIFGVPTDDPTYKISKVAIIKTIMLETGIQNGPLSIAIMRLTFPDNQLYEWALVPIYMWNFVIPIENIIIATIMSKIKEPVKQDTGLPLEPLAVES